MKYVMIYDKDDIYLPWMLLKLDDDGYITHWSSWCNSLNNIEDTDMFRDDKEEPVHLDDMVPPYTINFEANTYEELKLLTLMES